MVAVLTTPTHDQLQADGGPQVETQRLIRDIGFSLGELETALQIAATVEIVLRHEGCCETHPGHVALGHATLLGDRALAEAQRALEQLKERLPGD